MPVESVDKSVLITDRRGLSTFDKQSISSLISLFLII